MSVNSASLLLDLPIGRIIIFAVQALLLWFSLICSIALALVTSSSVGERASFGELHSGELALRSIIHIEAPVFKHKHIRC